MEEAPSEVPKKMTLKDRMKFFEDEIKKDKETAPKGRQLHIRFVAHRYERQKLGKKKQRKNILTNVRFSYSGFSHFDSMNIHNG